MHPRVIHLWFVILFDFGLALTARTYVPFLQSLGLNPSDVSMVNFGFFAAILACELPTGIFADHFGRTKSVQVGISVITGAALLYTTANGFKTALLYEVLIGVGYSFISGALSAWIRDALGARGEESIYSMVVTRATQYRSLAMLSGGLLGGFIGMYDKRLTWLSSGIVLFFAAHLAFKRMSEERMALGPSTASHTLVTDLSDKIGPLRQSIGLLRRTPALKWMVVGYFSFGCVLPLNHYWAPYFQTRIGELKTTLLWFPMHLSLAAGAYFVHTFGVKRERETSLISFAMLAAGLGLALMSHASSFALCLGFLVLHELGRGMFFPLLEIYTQHHVASSYRATYNSLQSLLARFGNLTVLGAVWYYTSDLPWDNVVISRVWTVSGLILAGVAILLWLLKPQSSPYS